MAWTVWYLAPSLSNLRGEVNARWPLRSKASDGTIGDAAHQATRSDHNPNDRGSVDAWDMTADGVDVRAVIFHFEKHPSAHYWIYDGQIADRDSAWVRRPYTGSNPHTKHAHFSIRQTRIAEEDKTRWGVWNPPERRNDMATAEEIWSAGFGTGENRRTAGQLLAENRKIDTLNAKLDMVADAVRVLLNGTGEEAVATAAKLEELDREAAERAVAMEQRFTAVLGQLDGVRVLLEQHAAGALDAEDVLRQMGRRLLADDGQGGDGSVIVVGPTPQ